VDLYTLVAMARGALEGRNAAEQTDYQRQQVEQQQDLAAQQVRDQASYQAGLLQHQRDALAFDQTRFTAEEKARSDALKFQGEIARYLAFHNLTPTEKLSEVGLAILKGVKGKAAGKAGPSTVSDMQQPGPTFPTAPAEQGPTMPIAWPQAGEFNPTPMVSAGTPPQAMMPVAQAPAPTLPVTMPLRTQLDVGAPPPQGNLADARLATTGITPQDISLPQAFATVAERVPGAAAQFGPGGAQLATLVPSALQTAETGTATTRTAAAQQEMIQSAARFPALMGDDAQRLLGMQLANQLQDIVLKAAGPMKEIERKTAQATLETALQRLDEAKLLAPEKVAHLKSEVWLLKVQAGVGQAQAGRLRMETTLAPGELRVRQTQAASSMIGAQASATQAATGQAELGIRRTQVMQQGAEASQRLAYDIKQSEKAAVTEADKKRIAYGNNIMGQAATILKQAQTKIAKTGIGDSSMNASIDYIKEALNQAYKTGCFGVPDFGDPATGRPSNNPNFFAIRSLSEALDAAKGPTTEG
jgi:hypothetical protein